MYDDASLYYSFNPSVQAQQEKSQLPKHKRRPSVLERPNVSLGLKFATDCFLISTQEDIQADTGRLDRLEDVLEAPQEVAGPPQATLSRRAQSYSDFHDVVKAVLGHDVVSKGTSKDTIKENEKIKEEEITSELDFADWYNGLEHKLLESSHDDYTSVTLGNVQR